MKVDFLIKPVFWIALVYAGVCLVMYLAQRKLQYFPDTRHAVPSDYSLEAITDVELTTKDGETIHGWYAKPGDPTKPLILYFQGNAEAIQSRWERAKLFTEEGYGVFMLSYRGYGGSTGTPTEAGLMLDAQAAYGFLREQGFSDDQLVYWGESLGSGIAVQLAAKHHPRAIILEAPFSSAADVARRSYWFLPVGLLMKDQFKSIDHVGSINAPLFIFHGDADVVVPYGLGQKLFDAAREPKKFHTVEGGGHVDPLTRPLWEKIKKFILQHPR